MRITASSLLALAVACLTAPAANYFVDSNAGNDANPGTQKTKPWRSLERVNSATLQPGDRVQFAAGSRWAGQLRITARGAPGQPLVFSRYGRGPMPRIDADGRFEDAVRLENAQHVVLRDLEITNVDPDFQGTNSRPRRGVHILAENSGTLTNIVVSDHFIHDVRGTQKIKHNGGIIFTTRGDRVPSRFDGLRIERNIIWRVDRSGIVAQSSHATRTRWFPSTGVMIRDNWLGDLGGDGITPWATDGCLVEHNIVEGANERAGTYNAGIWPWSTDNTVMRLNRASAVKTLLDGQGFDSDYNSRNTVIEFNLSHENEGGFLLVCTPGKRNQRENLGNTGTVVRHNISYHDQARTFHFAGAPENTFVHDNAVYTAPGSDVQLMFTSDWDGWARGVCVSNNLFSVAGVGRYGHQLTRDYANGAYTIAPGWGPATNIVFTGNKYVGKQVDRPPDETSVLNAPKPIQFRDWPGPLFNPANPQKFPAFIKAHRKWMMKLMQQQFGKRPE